MAMVGIDNHSFDHTKWSPETDKWSDSDPDHEVKGQFRRVVVNCWNMIGFLRVFGILFITLDVLACINILVTPAFHYIVDTYALNISIVWTTLVICCIFLLANLTMLLILPVGVIDVRKKYKIVDVIISIVFAVVLFFLCTFQALEMDKFEEWNAQHGNNWTSSDGTQITEESEAWLAVAVIAGITGGYYLIAMVTISLVPRSRQMWNCKILLYIIILSVLAIGATVVGVLIENSFK